MESRVETLIVLLLASAVVAIVCRRARLPYTVGLVAAGIGLAWLPFAPHITLTRELLFTALLPPLLFEGAYHLSWKQLRRDLVLVSTLATLGVLLSATVTACGLHWLLGWPWISAAVFGSLIAATDPVSVIATFKEARAEGRLRNLIEAESLFNDGTAAVLCSVVLAVAMGQAPSPATTAWLLFESTAGGVLCGLLVGGVALAVAGRARDHLVKIVLTAVAAYGAFFVADRLGLSGVLATIAAGILLGNAEPAALESQRTRQIIEDLWEFGAFVANSIVFLLIGIELAARAFRPYAGWAVAAIAVVLAARAATVLPCSMLFLRTQQKVPWRHQVALVWGGLRGALALALALSLPEGMAYREAILTLTFAVVAFSVFVEGLTMTPLLRWIGEIPRKKAI